MLHSVVIYSRILLKIKTVLVYNQLHDPPPGDVLDAVMAIDAAYDSNQEIIEVVPGNWV